MKILLALSAVSLLASAPQPAGAATAQARFNEPLHCEAPQPSDYPIADVYRLTAVSASTPTVLPVAAASAAPAPEPRPWPLLASGLAAALWVARRRLHTSF